VYDAVFVGSASAAAAGVRSRVLFFPEHEKLPVEFTGWEPTGYQWREYKEFVFPGSEIPVPLFSNHAMQYPPFQLSASALVTATHPVTTREMAVVSTVVGPPFHAYRDDKSVRLIQSDLPLTHVYEDRRFTSFGRGNVGLSPSMRNYQYSSGVWHGTGVIKYSTVGVTIWVLEQGTHVVWDFIGPENWKRLPIEQMKELGTSDGFVPVFSSDQNLPSSFVPPTYAFSDVVRHLGSTNILRRSDGWYACSVSAAKFQGLEDVEAILERSGSEIARWIKLNGGFFKMFSFSRQKSGIKIEGLSRWSRFYSGLSDPKMKKFKADLCALFKMHPDGPYWSALNIKTHDRFGIKR